MVYTGHVDAYFDYKLGQLEYHAICLKAGIHYGRPQTTFPKNWDVVYAQWKAQDITADEAAVKLGISKATL